MPKRGVKFSVRLPALVEREGDGWVATCESLDVVTNGRTRAEAKAALVEAVQLFIEDCFLEGTLTEVLRECGFTPSAHSTRTRRKAEPKRKPGAYYWDVPAELLVQHESEAHPA
jgi:predicted RNase H-like HicB family nuclease